MNECKGTIYTYMLRADSTDMVIARGYSCNAYYARDDSTDMVIARGYSCNAYYARDERITCEYEGPCM